MMQRASPILEVRSLAKRFGDHGAAGLRNVDFSVSNGETLAVVGASGSGKTTLARLVMRLLPPEAGSIHFRGQDITALRGEGLRRLRPHFQMVFQDPLAAFNPRASVRRVLEDPLRLHGLAAKAEYDTVICATAGARRSERRSDNAASAGIVRRTTAACRDCARNSDQARPYRARRTGIGP
nr:ATP-binding cassette domain-containing protein [Phyllobacterium sp. A18/5-2]